MIRFLPYVNTRMGSDSTPRFSTGNTLPYTQLPHAMVGFVPQTDGGKGSWYYDPRSRIIEGIRLTHQPSPWIGDYGTFLFTPQADRLYTTAEGARSGFRPDEAQLGPDRLSVYFQRQRCALTLVPTERGGALTVSFDEMPGDLRALTVFPVKGENRFHADPTAHVLYGCTTGHGDDRAVDFKMYLACIFEADAVDWEKSGTFPCGAWGEGFHIMWRTAVGRMRIGVSYLSEEQALYNAHRETDGEDTETLGRQAAERWESILSRMEIVDAEEGRMRTFYSCLYRAFLFPHKAYEYDRETGVPVHYSPFDGGKKKGVRYTDNGFWDTYRTVYPLYALIAREEYAEILDGFVADWRDGGWLPRWTSIGEVGCMPGTLIDAVIADAAVKGIGRRTVWAEAFEGMLHHASNNGPEPRYGRNGAELYCKIGYVPCDKYRESVNLTLDAAYGDYCIARVAQVLGFEDLTERYDRRAQNYRKLFDGETGFMRGRTEKGEMASEFDPCSWGGDYTEGSAWQTTFAVPHDVEGLASLYGGREGFLKKLDALFDAKPLYRVGGYGQEIHEMTELAAQAFGQCAISNQPSFHIPFLYSLMGEREKASSLVRRMADTFSWERGYPGDEDNGSMSAWYIFACLGIYPVCPGMPGTKGYARTEMLVPGMRVCGQAWDPDRIEAWLR